jgi:hypothetical protein
MSDPTFLSGCYPLLTQHDEELQGGPEILCLGIDIETDRFLRELLTGE